MQVSKATTSNIAKLGSIRTTTARCFATQPSLDQELPGTAAQVESKYDTPKTKVSTLKNGLRVATFDNFQPATSISLIADAGSRYENDSNQGVSSFLARMAYKSTEDRSRIRVVRDLEEKGAFVSADAARDYIQYNAECLRGEHEVALARMADTVIRPKYAPWDIEEQQKVFELELEERAQDPGLIINEKIHEAAYNDSSSLGRSRFLPKRNLKAITKETMVDYTNSTYSAKRMVLSATGVDHDAFVKQAEQYFSDLPSDPLAETPVVETPEYVGGERRVRDGSPTTHLALGFKGCDWKSDDLFDFCVLNMLLGGGGSFSAGGPGKGMYSRLYSNVLNQHGWVESASAFNCIYPDAGLIGVYGSSMPQYAGYLAQVVAGELKMLATTAPSEEETNRAKNQLLAAVLNSLDFRTPVCEDMGRQLLTYGERKEVSELKASIEKVTPESIRAATEKALSSPVSLAAFGDVQHVPTVATINSWFK